GQAAGDVRPFLAAIDGDKNVGLIDGVGMMPVGRIEDDTLDLMSVGDLGSVVESVAGGRADEDVVGASHVQDVDVGRPVRVGAPGGDGADKLQAVVPRVHAEVVQAERVRAPQRFANLGDGLAAVGGFINAKLTEGDVVACGIAGVDGVGD